jgi:hypothetical protein
MFGMQKTQKERLIAVVGGVPITDKDLDKFTAVIKQRHPDMSITFYDVIALSAMIYLIRTYQNVHQDSPGREPSGSVPVRKKT